MESMMESIFAHMVFADFGGEAIRRAPFATERIVVENVRGYRVRLPVTGAEAANGRPAAEAAVRRAMSALASMDVSVALPPEGFAACAEGFLPLARGTDTLPFLLPRAVKKALSAIGRELPQCEFAVLCDDTALSVRVLERLSREAGIRFLSAVGGAEALEPLREATARMYRETGLNIVLSEQRRQALARADVVIHTAPPSADFTALYRKNAVCLDLSGSRGMTAALLARRGDVLAADGLYASLGKTTLPHDVLSLVLYGKSAAFARLVREGGGTAAEEEAHADIRALRVSVAAYMQAGRALSVAALARRMK